MLKTQVRPNTTNVLQANNKQIRKRLMKIGTFDFVMDDLYQKVESLPDDPPASVPFMVQTEMAVCFVMLRPIPANKTMPFGNPQAVIDGIHQCLSNQQGLIKVDAGQTNKGNRFIYSIVKTVNPQGGVQYGLTFHISDGISAVALQGFFEETGTTGQRENLTLQTLLNEGRLKMGPDGPEDWFEDPYDSGFKRGIPMNLSEKESIDGLFPSHPISECRRFIKSILEQN